MTNANFDQWQLLNDGVNNKQYAQVWDARSDEMFMVRYKFADSNGNFITSPATVGHTYWAELWNGTAQITTFSFAIQFLNNQTILFYPINVAVSTVNS